MLPPFSSLLPRSRSSRHPRLIRSRFRTPAANRGITDDTSRGLLLRQMEDAIDLAPGALVLMVGANDLAQKASGVVFLGNVRLIIEAPKKHNATMPTVLSETSPCAPDEYRPVTIPCPAS